MAITDAQIRGIAAPQASRDLLVKLNDGAASATDIHASLTSLEEKRAMLAVLGGVATRSGLNAHALSLPIKAVLLAMANV